MAVDPTMVISIDRTGMPGALAPLEFQATPGIGVLGIVAYTEPTVEALTRYASQSDYEDGQEPRGATMLNTVLRWDFVTDAAATEQSSRGLVAEVQAAIRRLRYSVTVTLADADAEVWRVMGFGSLAPPSRTRANIEGHNPVWGLTLPVNPNRTIT